MKTKRQTFIIPIMLVLSAFCLFVLSAHFSNMRPVRVASAESSVIRLGNPSFGDGYDYLNWTSASTGFGSPQTNSALDTGEIMFFTEGTMETGIGDVSGMIPDEIHSHGITAHAHSVINFNVAAFAGAVEFRAYVGISLNNNLGDVSLDPGTGALTHRAGADFIVEIDGIIAYQTGRVAWNAGNREVAFEIPAGANTMTLITTGMSQPAHANNPIASAHTAWADARLVPLAGDRLMSASLSADTLLAPGDGVPLSLEARLIDGTTLSGADLSDEGANVLIVSSNEAVVSISGNLTTGFSLNAVDSGLATITAEIELRGRTVTAVLDVTVFDEQDMIIEFNSPDNNIEVAVFLSTDGSASYLVRNNGNIVVGRSSLGLVSQVGTNAATRVNFSTGLTYVSHTIGAIVDYTYQIPGRMTEFYRNHYREVTVRFEATDAPVGSPANLNVIFRVYNDGIALRYAMPMISAVNDFRILDEATFFRVPATSDTWTMPYDIQGGQPGFGYGQNAFSYEGGFVKMPVEDIPRPPARWSPISMPMLYRTPTGEYVMLAQAHITGMFASQVLHSTDHGLRTFWAPIPNRLNFAAPIGTAPTGGSGQYYFGPLPTGTISGLIPQGYFVTNNFDAGELFITPWRTAIIGDLETMINNTMVDNLSPDPQRPTGHAVTDFCTRRYFTYETDGTWNNGNGIADFDWIRPGVTSWSWLKYGTDAQSDPNLHMQQIELAYQMGWDYYILDEGWQPARTGWGRAANHRQTWYHGTFDWFEEVKAFADERGIGLFAWVWVDDLNTTAKMRQQLDLFVELGMVGIKVDFFDCDTQCRMNLYDIVYRETAKRQLIVNVHGNIPPHGEARKWPHVLTKEGIRGNEYQQMIPEQYTMIPFIRGAIGAGDVTETVNPMTSDSTVGFQVALPTLIHNPLRTFASRAYEYFESPALYMYKSFPAVWDETRHIAGDIGEYSAVARRSGGDWYMSAVTFRERTENFALDFLGAGTYYAFIYTDDMNGDHFALNAEFREVTASTVLEITMKENGGFAAMILRDRPEIPTAMSFDGPEAVERGSNITLSPNIVAAEGAIRQLVWETADSNIATVSRAGRVTGLNVGTTTITARSFIDPSVYATVVLNVEPDRIGLNTERWNILRDTGGVSFNSSTSMNIINERSGEFGDPGRPIDNIVWTPVPAIGTQAADFDARVRVSGGLVANFQTISLAAFTGDGMHDMAAVHRRHHSYLGAGANNHVFQLSYHPGGMEHVTADTHHYNDVWLRLTKEGSLFRGLFSFDGINWTLIHSGINRSSLDTDQLRIGLIVNCPNNFGFDVTFEDFSVNFWGVYEDYDRTRCNFAIYRGEVMDLLNDIDGLNLNQNNYSSASWTILTQAKGAAAILLADASSSQAQFDAMVKTLTAAVEGLVSVFAGIDEAITAAEARVQANYTPASWTAMQAALTAARQARNDSSATVADIEYATEALTLAIQALTAINANGGPPDDPPGGCGGCGSGNITTLMLAVLTLAGGAVIFVKKRR